MSKYYGALGFAITRPRPDFPSVMEEVITEKKYFGDLTRISRRLQSARDSVTNDLTLNNELSIVMDDYLSCNFNLLVYVVINGVKWTVTSVEVERPRLILSIGGVYNAKD